MIEIVPYKIEPPKQEILTHVTLRKYEVIEILQALEGLKKRLQPLLEQKSK